MGEGVQRYKFPVIKEISLRDVMYDIVTILNNILYI